MMEVTDISKFSGLDGSDLIALRAEESAIFAVDDYSNEAEMFLEQHGRGMHPIFDKDEKYLQQRFTVPTQSAFK